MIAAGFRIISTTFAPGPIQLAKARAARRVGMRAGAYVMTDARRSIKQRKKISPAGSPPSSHTKRLKRSIRFAYEPATLSTVVGPIAYSGGVGDMRHLEEGGTTTLTRRGQKVRATFAARPFMRPAQDLTTPKLAGFWADALTK